MTVPPVHPAHIRAAREAAGHTQAQAAAAVLVARRTWLAWEAGSNAMPPGLWLLYRLRTGVATLDELPGA